MSEQEPSRSETKLLAGRCAVVTGASSGLGRAMALALADAGADVWVHCRSRLRRAEETVAAARELGVDSVASAGDLSDSTRRRELCEQAWQWKPQGAEIWINNAGADVLTGDSASAAFQEKLARLWSVDVLGTIGLSREIGGRMKEAGERGDQRDRTIINIGWDQAEQGMEGDSGEMFGAIKGAVMAFTRSLARSLAPEVRVNCIAPGWIRTAWGEQASDAWQGRAVRESLLERWGTPEDVADAAVFLASTRARFLTGVTLPVNGGFRHGAPG